MLLRRFAILVGLLALVLALTGCGSSGSSGASPSAWVKSVCGAVGPFEKDVAARSGALDLGAIKNPTQGKSVLRGFLQAIADDASTAQSKLQAAGTPNVAHGQRIETAIVGAFGQVKRAMSAAATNADSMPTDSVAAFQQASKSLGSTVQTSIAGIGSSLSNLKSPVLVKAASKEPACTALSST